MDVYDALARARARGQRVVLVTVLAVDGDAPSRPGAKLVVGDGEVLAGTLGCAEFDAAGVVLASDALGAEAPVRRRQSFAPGEAHGRERSLELFAEVSLPEPALLVLGANPLARGLAAFARLLGRRAVVIAPGGDAAVPAGVQVTADDPVRALLAAPPGATDAVVVTDHDAPWAHEALRVALASDAFYVGMPGSSRHAPLALRRLRDAGVPEAHVARLRTPIGLDIGSHSAEEIALSIMAEVVAVEHGRPGGVMRRDVV